MFFFSVKYPVIHVLRISEEAEKPSMEKNNQQKNAKSTVNLAKPLSLHEPKSVAFVEASGCDPHQTSPNKSRPVQLASIKLHQSTELGPDVYLMQGKKGLTFIFFIYFILLVYLHSFTLRYI